MAEQKTLDSAMALVLLSEQKTKQKQQPKDMENNKNRKVRKRKTLTSHITPMQLECSLLNSEIQKFPSASLRAQWDLLNYQDLGSGSPEDDEILEQRIIDFLRNVANDYLDSWAPLILSHASFFHDQPEFQPFLKTIQSYFEEKMDDQRKNRKKRKTKGLSQILNCLNAILQIMKGIQDQVNKENVFIEIVATTTYTQSQSQTQTEPRDPYDL
jgi:hypothetical protein